MWLTQNKKKTIQCLNCGIYGHTSKYCNFPTTSYGIVCYKVDNKQIFYVMIQRKDTLYYVEFVRGNYNIKNKNYIIQMFSKMTMEEREYIRNNSFDDIWNKLWVDNKKNNSHYKTVKEKFNMLKNGYYIKGKNGLFFFDLNNAIDSCKSTVSEQEWEFPKGRRKLGEKDFQCAVREFHEESNINANDLYFCDMTRYFEEVYLSSNKTRYRNIYYIAKMMNTKNEKKLFDIKNKNQTKEVRDVNWFSLDEVIEKIQSRNIEKYETFRLIHDIICKKYEVPM